ncbi:MAG: class IV adenylate cyclase [Candidatus Lokiarchaeota archaeon]|nr:class IV adenylate cyclase [Candidatus Lokiarchaeota archaeon]
MIEVEIKVEITDPAKLREEFAKKNGVYKCSLLHEDTYFNMPEGLRDFRKSDEALRVRKSLEFDMNQENVKSRINYFLTYKGAKLSSKAKTRKELETIVEEGDKILDILKLLGFREVLTVKKERELYEFHHNSLLIEALIDYIPILNRYFLEVECQVIEGGEIEHFQDKLFEFLLEFGIKKDRSITLSYLELIALHLDQ